MRSEVAILIIVHKESPNRFEDIALKQCFKVLGGYPIFLICPEGLNVEHYRDIAPQIIVDPINPKWMSSYSNFNTLKVKPFIYKRYSRYKFILFYELDAFVFRDELAYWCQKGYDYIGAPWFEGNKMTEDSPIVGAGNGGFSLRKVDSLLKVLHSYSLVYNPQELYAMKAYKSNKLIRLLSVLKNMTIKNNFYHFLNSYKDLEDVFWAIYAKRSFGWFKVAEADEALRFSFEVKPRSLYEMNNRNLPFGCHGWRRYDIDFWAPFIRKEGYDL